jgi:GxxExxY protein
MRSTFAGPDDEQTGMVIAAAIEVHKTVGHGFLERAHGKALERELLLRGVPVRMTLPIPVYYKGEKLGCG